MSSDSQGPTAEQVLCPIIVTAGMDARAQSCFDDLRERYFPPGRTVVGAHLTLFHALPADARSTVLATLTALCAETSPFSAAVKGLYSLGRGVAARIESARLSELRKKIAAPMRERLTPQDAQTFRPHITITNKLTAAEAKAAHQTLQTEWMPAEITLESLIIWRYLGPHWQLDTRVPCIGVESAGRRM